MERAFRPLDFWEYLYDGGEWSGSQVSKGKDTEYVESDVAEEM